MLEPSAIAESPLLTPPCYDPSPLVGASTPLDPIETSGYVYPDVPDLHVWYEEHFPHPTLETTENLSQTFRHSGWRGRRQLVLDAMRRMDVSGSRRSAFCGCGRECYVLRNREDPSILRIAASCCHDRFCLPCGTSRSRTIAAAVQAYMAGAPCRFVTLTLRTNDLTLTEQLSRLYQCFAKLRKTRLWKRSQTGGVAFLELKRSKSGENWHPHFHILTQGKFIPVARLSELWKSITGDSHIVDVRLVREATQATQYVTKYASKPMDSTIFLKNETLDEAVTALAKRRMIITFGTWKGLNPTANPEADAWERLDTLDNLIIRAAQHDHEAVVIVYALTKSQAPDLILRAATMLPQPRPPDLPGCDFRQLTIELGSGYLLS